MIRAIGAVLGILWRFLRPSWRLAVVAVALNLSGALAEGLAMLVLAVLAGVLAGQTVIESTAALGQLGKALISPLASLEQNQLALALLALLVLLQLGRAGLLFGGKVASIKMQTEIDGRTRQAVFNQFMRLSFSQLKSYRTGEMTSLIEHVMYLGLVFTRLNTILSQILLMLAYLVILAWISLAMTLGVALAGALITLGLAQLVRRVRQQGARYTEASVALSKEIVEFLQGFRLIQTFAREGFARQRVRQIVEQGIDAHKRTLVLQAVISPIVDSITVLGMAGVLVLGVWHLGGLQGPGLARLATFVFVLYRFVPRIRVINDNAGLVLGYLPFVERIAHALDDTGKELQHIGGRLQPAFEDRVEFQDVSYRYPGAESDAVSGLSFEIRRGTTVALVGPSGGGKSTVADLLIGLIQPTNGKILIDGQPLSELDWMSWRDMLGVVSQDTFIFSATIAENVAFGNFSADEAGIVQACIEADAHRFITAKQAGYKTLVGNQGARLSGGQRQRLGIARALVRKPDLLILDEATSNLDSRAEQGIQRSLRKASAKRTTFAIAHRLSTISHADLILVLDDGRVVESGSHESLISSGGQYAALWKLQSTSQRRSGASSARDEGES